MKKKWKQIVCMWLAGLVVFGSADYCRQLQTVHAATQKVKISTAASTPKPTTLQDQIDSAQAQQKQLQSQKAKVEADLKVIRKAKKNVKEYVEKLDKKMNALEDTIAKNEEELESAQKEYDALNKELNLALTTQQSQYETMKKRIQYMYENSDTNYFQILMESKNLIDLYSRSEYISKIMSYDKTLLSRYSAVVTEVNTAREQAATKLNDVTRVKDSLTYEKRAVKEMLKEKMSQIQIYQGQMTDSANNITSYTTQIAKQEQEIEKLLAQQRITFSQQQTAGTGTVVAGTGKYRWPLTVAGTITSRFGARTAPTAGASTYHKGIDIAVPVGTSVLATQSGKVVTATYSSSAGNYICIYHGNGTYSYYMHNSRLLVTAGQTVKKGQIISKSGCTGISTGPHLHFGLYKNGGYVNPLFYVSQK